MRRHNAECIFPSQPKVTISFVHNRFHRIGDWEATVFPPESVGEAATFAPSICWSDGECMVGPCFSFVLFQVEWLFCLVGR